MANRPARLTMCLLSLVAIGLAGCQSLPLAAMPSLAMPNGLLAQSAAKPNDLEAVKLAIRKAIEKKAPGYEVRLDKLDVKYRFAKDYDFKGTGVIHESHGKTTFDVWGYHNAAIDKTDFELTRRTKR